MRNRKHIWTGIILFNWAIIVGFWLHGSGELLKTGLAGALIAFGRLAGLSAAFMVLRQFFLMGRFPLLERVVGLDRLSRVHQKNGKRAILLILLHPILILWGSSLLAGVNGIDVFVSFITTNKHLLWAFLAVILFSVVVVTSLVIVRSRLKYESWYFVHLITYIAVFLSFFHQINLGHTITGSTIFYGYWVTLYTLIFASHLVFRIIRPIFISLKHKFQVERIERESPSAVSIYISGEALERFNIHPGQFMILRFFARGLWWQAHPFSLSKMPDGKTLRITVKELGDFTGRIKNVPLGTKILIDGPYGVFTDLFSISNKTLFIAGGIGITPIRSLSEEMLRNGKDSVLLYANRTEKDIVFKKELDTLENQYDAKIIHVLSDQNDYAGEKGRIDEEKIRRLVPDLLSRDVYLCGPVPMMEGLIPVLKKLGLSGDKIHYEKFSF